MLCTTRSLTRIGDTGRYGERKGDTGTRPGAGLERWGEMARSGGRAESGLEQLDSDRLRTANREASPRAGPTGESTHLRQGKVHFSTHTHEGGRGRGQSSPRDSTPSHSPAHSKCKVRCARAPCCAPPTLIAARAAARRRRSIASPPWWRARPPAAPAARRSCRPIRTGGRRVAAQCLRGEYANLKAGDLGRYGEMWAACAVSTPTSGREDGIVQCIQSTAWARGRRVQ